MFQDKDCFPRLPTFQAEETAPASLGVRTGQGAERLRDKAGAGTRGAEEEGLRKEVEKFQVLGAKVEQGLLPAQGGLKRASGWEASQICFLNDPLWLQSEKKALEASGHSFQVRGAPR